MTTTCMPYLFVQHTKEFLSPGYATGTSVQDFVGWMAVGILIILIVGMLMYLFWVRNARERQRQMALARVRPSRTSTDGVYGSSPGYRSRTDGYDEDDEQMPEAVRAAYDDIRIDRKDRYGRYDGDESQYGRGTYEARDPYVTLTPSRRDRTSPGAAGKPYPPISTPQKPDVLEGFLDSRRRSGETVKLEAEDRQLLWEEAHEPEAPAAVPEEDEVLFIDEETEDAASEEGTAEAGGPQARDDFVTGPLALMLLQKDIEKAAREGRRGQATREGPAWSEGRPVFSKPLEEPTEVTTPGAARPPPLDMDEFTVQLKSLAEKKKAESRRLEDERKSRDKRRTAEDAARLQQQAQREQALRREIRGMVRAGISEKQKHEAPLGPPGVSAAEEEARRAEDDKKLEEARRKEERRKRWLELQKKHEVETIEDVLPRIGIK